ncbi:hypothetical protein [Paraburkholderia azotifigens]|uniref:Uncharacterized protein n=1 Tax=Paraburkholderia azotifigens TaxID=2057004 RepID=A0A5C6V5W2_9BURK|nr:hypothetical protein [Paraburkholderia azotifigens]TXC79816.1 hypothetical protein FRZ40_36440 [Paraburkholderia azotifigens]
MSDLKNVRDVMDTGNCFLDDAVEALVQYQAAPAHRQPRIVYSNRRISPFIINLRNAGRENHERQVSLNIRQRITSVQLFYCY